MPSSSAAPTPKIMPPIACDRAVQRIRLDTDQNGRILAIGHEVFAGNLPSEQTYEGAAMQTRTLYAGANRLTRHRLAPLDIPIASSMRAPGEAVGMLALECAMDELAAEPAPGTQSRNSLLLLE
jgi:CO/xanthine dehydrogenase Mo-binding subunit